MSEQRFQQLKVWLHSFFQRSKTICAPMSVYVYICDCIMCELKIWNLYVTLIWIFSFVVPFPIASHASNCNIPMAVYVCVCVCHCYGAYLCGIHKMQAVKIKQTNKAPLNTNNEKWNRRQWHCNIVSFVSFFRSFLRYDITMLSIATSNQIEKQSVWRERITYLVLILACIYLYFL